MNAIVTSQAPRAFSEPGVVAGAAPQALVPTTFEGVFRMAQVIAASGMAPKGMDTPEACTVAIMNGLEIGLTPMQAVQSIAIVNGRPTVWGDAAKALCLGSPMCEDIVETITGTGDNMVARCEAKRKGKSPSVGEFSVAKAKKANLWGKSGPWQQYPERMLQLRARAFALRDAFPDVLRGVAIREEMEDVVDARDVTPPAPPAPPSPPKIKGPVIDAKGEPEHPAEKVAEVQAAAPPAAEQPEESLIEIGYDPDTVIADLIDMLSRCETVEEVEVGYDTFDAEAALAHFEQADYVARARQIKKQHLDRVEAAAAKSAPPKPPEAEKKANSLDDDSPPVPPATEPDLSTLEAYNSYARNVVGGWYDPVKISQWWTETRAVRAQLDMSMEMRKSLQDYLENRMKAAESAAR
jgi:hypothetical protein